MEAKQPAQKRYPPELRDRAVRMVTELRQQDPHDDGVISRVARRLGVGKESLRSWVKQAEVDSGARAGTTTADHAELVELRTEVKQLCRANDILQADSLRSSTADAAVIAFIDAHRDNTTGGHRWGADL